MLQGHNGQKKGYCKSYTPVDDINPALPFWTLNSGNYGIFLLMGNAGFRSSAVVFKGALRGLTGKNRNFRRVSFSAMCIEAKSSMVAWRVAADDAFPSPTSTSKR